MIPSFLVPGCFWDCEPGKIDPQAHRRFVIERVLEFGNDEAVRWLLRTYSHEEIACVLHISRVLTEKTVQCWTNYLDSGEEGTLCTTRSYPRKG